MTIDLQKSTNSFKVTLNRLDGDRAVLVTDDNHEIVLEKKDLPKALTEGDVAVLSIATEEAEALLHDTKAKELLNELLK
jgi:hypothetical protein